MRESNIQARLRKQARLKCDPKLPSFVKIRLLDMDFDVNKNKP